MLFAIFDFCSSWQWTSKGVLKYNRIDALVEFECDVTSLAMSPELLIAGSVDGTLKVYNFQLESVVAELNHEHQPLRAVGMCLGSTFAVSLCAKGVLKLWDIILQKCVMTGKHDDGSARKKFQEKVAMAVSEDGDLAITASETYIKCWDGHIRCALNVVPSHVESVYKSSLEVRSGYS